MTADPTPVLRSLREAPKRIQLSRKKGWRKPEGAIKVDRTTRFGNPFVVGEVALDRADAVAKLRLHLNVRRNPHDGWVDLICYPSDEDIAELRGHDLACWCPLDQPCHADVLLELANA